MYKTYVEMFTDMVNTMLKKESFTSDPNSVNSVYMGQIALSLSAIADELRELNGNLKMMSCPDPVPSKNEQEEHGTESPSENAQEPEYPQPEFSYDLMIDATTVVSLMYNEIETKGYVTVADVKRFSNTEPNELDNLYGWYDIDPFNTLEVCDFKNIPPTRYLLKLPPVKRIKEIK